ncbi:hypothetical protein PTTG_29101 [Puccinia triticina 1-1 BBBD Race 1]|uniref:Uncharacterized protein n=1 Tax=Puccinia triticina (isolate 1-1 / race 1 (BBBD)) TaxID=630390 RepID=A0A180G6C2_PUCT1|nr:hypothetical protein PTTG_29101 [Puccinia triticina 1-1 BBBD Race 1]
MGRVHRENVRGHDEEMAQEQRERHQAEMEENSSQPAVQDNYWETENHDQNPATYNHQDDLDAMAATARLQELPFFTRLNLDDEISLQDLIDAEIEEILRQEDAAIFEGPDYEEEEVDLGEAARWFPFKNKMELVGSLLIGHTHSMISRAIYNKIRAVMSICDIRLPAWATVRGARIRIQKLLCTQLKTETSAFGTPCFYLSVQGILSQDLANPQVSPHIDYYPEMTHHSLFKFSQSKKWLEELAPQHRAPMCQVNQEHFYLFEPVELTSGLIIIPIFFYSQDSQLYSKCIAPDFETYTEEEKTLSKMKIPQDIQFNHPRLLIIPTSEFKKSYAHIEFNGKKISEECGGAIYENQVPQPLAQTSKW